MRRAAAAAAALVILVAGSPGLSAGGCVAPGASLFQFTQDEVTVREHIDLVAVVSVERIGDATCESSVRISSEDGTATKAQDFQGVSQALSFEPGEAGPVPIHIPIVDDFQDEGSETFTLRLGPADGAGVGVRNGTRVTILDDVGGLRFSASAVDGQEERGKQWVQVHVERIGETAKSLTVSVVRTGGTANVRTDLQWTKRDLTFYPGDRLETVTVRIFDDHDAEDTETLELALTNVGQHGWLAVPNETTLFILDDENRLPDPEVPDPEPVFDSILRFSNRFYSVLEDASSVRVDVIRDGRASGEASVTWKVVSAVDAVADASGVITFAAGQRFASFTVPVLDDTLRTGNRAITLSLTDAPDAILGEPSSGVLTIIDDEADRRSLDDSRTTPAGPLVTILLGLVTLAAARRFK